MIDDAAAVGRLVTTLRLRRRGYPVVGISSALDSGEPVLSGAEVRRTVGPDARICFVPADDELRVLERLLGWELALSRGSVRVWWPGVSRRSDPADHPLVRLLEGEAALDLREEFQRAFDLSRPHVRRELSQLEDALALAERELRQAQRNEQLVAEQLRKAQVERRREASRAERAETRPASGKRGTGKGVKQIRLSAYGPDAPELDLLLRAFGENVSALRGAAGLSQPQIAARCFLRADQVSEVEGGHRALSLPVLLLLAAGLGVSVGQLTDDLPAPMREAGRAEILALVTREHRERGERGVSTAELVRASRLPGMYVGQLIPYMESAGEIVRARGGWRPAPRPTPTATHTL